MLLNILACCFVALLILLVLSVARVRRENERRWGKFDESGIRQSLQILLKRGYHGGFVTFSERDRPEFIQVRKYISAPGEFGIEMHFPRAPWSQRYYQEVDRMVRTRLRNSERIPVVGEPVVEFIEADFASDVELATLIVVGILKEIFGWDCKSVRVTMDDIYPEDVLVDRLDFARLTIREALRIPARRPGGATLARKLGTLRRLGECPVRLVRVVLCKVGVAALLVAGGIAAAASVMFYDDYSQSHWTPPGFVFPLFLFTGITFAAVLTEFRRLWRKPRLWAGIAFLLLVHVAGYVMVLLAVPDFRAPWFALVAIVETPLLCSALDRVVR